MRRFKHLIAAGLVGMATIGVVAAEPTVDHPPPLSPAEAVRHFKVAEGLEISLVVAEPEIAQPLSISFDDRGRMWLLEYRQYPNPNGLKAVEMDNWLRTKYDKVPAAPPQGPKGADRISICDDTDGDGHIDTVKSFVDDLNLASGMALGFGGVFVVQSPYLLFYADADGDDRPDGPPEVLLKGFGMEDAHAFANSLTFGPDGWLYGAQGSTATADIRGIGFQQGVWRYHPRTKQFELFAEGGGNTWGVEFDRVGNLFAAGNTVEPLVHHVQGAYYVKGFGKHGPLHNPHAYGYFQPVLHHGYVGDSLTGGAIIYQGGAFPDRFNNACIAPNTRHSACRWSTIETRGSTFATRHAGDFVVSDDIWFRPVDMTVGPDGAVYIADWYDYNISHSSPKNRSQWYEPSRRDGRVWRVAPPSLKAAQAVAFDLKRKSSDELIALLDHPNDWYARAARRIFADRRDGAVATRLAPRVTEVDDQRVALEALWSVYVSGGLNDELADKWLASRHEYVRAWTVRLLGDEPQLSTALADRLARMAREETSVVVRSQLACSAKRLPAGAGLAIVSGLLTHDEDAEDVHVPLLIWWAVEDKTASDTSAVLDLLSNAETWRRPLVERFLIERLARRLAAMNDDRGFAACARLWQMAPNTNDAQLVQGGILQALAGRQLAHVPAALKDLLRQSLAAERRSAAGIELALRMNAPTAAERALASVRNKQVGDPERVALIKALGETRTAMAVEPLVALLDASQSEAVQVAALSALGYFQNEQLASQVLERVALLKGGAQARAIELLCGRAAWARELLTAIDRGQVSKSAITLDLLKQLRALDDEQVAEQVARQWGRVQTATPLEKQGRITAVVQMLGRAPGDPARGQAHFTKVCATCHKLQGQGNSVGPDLTGADRKNRDLLVRNIVDPSAMIRQEFLAHVATTADGRVLTGLLAESTADTVTLLDAQNKRTVLPRSELEELRESEISLMPDNLLDELFDQQIRDLFAFLQAEVTNR